MGFDDDYRTEYFIDSCLCWNMLGIRTCLFVQYELVVKYDVSRLLGR